MLALLRVLVEGAEKGGRVDVDLRRVEGDLVISLSAAPLIESAADLLARFEGLGVRCARGLA